MPGRGSISTQHENVQHTRMRHGQKHAVSKIGEGNTPRPPIKRPSLVSHSKQKKSYIPQAFKGYL